MAPPAPARPRRRLVLAGVAVAVVVLHGWGLGGAGTSGRAPERVAVAPVPVLDTRMLAPPMAEAAAPVVAVVAAPPPAAAAVRRAREAAAPAAPAPEAPPSDDVVDAPADAAEAPEPVVQPVAEAAPPSGGASDPDPGTPDAVPAVAVAAAAAGLGAAPPAVAAVAPPVYATRLAAPFVARYALQRGMLGGAGSLRWAPTADGRYEARLEGSVAGFNVLDWRSAGLIDRAGIAPERFLIQRRGRDAQAANFQRGIGKITYSGPSVQHDLPVGAQDRLSWMLQIGGVLNAAPKRFGVGAHIDFFVSGARGDADLWQFNVVGLESVRAGGREVMAVKLQREPRKPYDTRVEVWLDPAREHRPVRARLANGNNEEALELRLDE